MCFSHVTDATGSRGTIRAWIASTVSLWCGIWGLVVPVSILGKLLTGKALSLLAPPGDAILVLQSLAWSWLSSQLGHSRGLQEPASKPKAKTGDYPHRTSVWDRSKETRKELPQPLGVGRSFRSVFFLRNIFEGGTSAVTGSAGAPVWVAGSCQ